MGVVLLFLLANELLRFLLPFVSFGGLLELSLPYLAAGLLTMFWVYSPASKTAAPLAWPGKPTNSIQLSE